MELSAILIASFIREHPYISAGILLYFGLVGFFVYAMKTAPRADKDGKTAENVDDEVFW